MMSFDEYCASPLTCRDCGVDVPNDSMRVDIDDEGQTVAHCEECAVELQAKFDAIWAARS